MITLLKRWLGNGSADRPGGFEVCLAGSSGAPNVLVFTEHINATYYISFDFPLRQLHAQGRANFAVVSQSSMAEGGKSNLDRWSKEFQPNVVMMSRYSQPYGEDILQYFKRQRIPVIYHIDDDLLDLPNSLGGEIIKRHGAADVTLARRYLLSHCDLIYASTATLAEVMRGRFPGQRIFHGIYAPYLTIPGPIRQRRSGVTIGYMGSKGHQNDLALAVPALVRLLDEHPQLEFHLFGTIALPSDLERFGDRVRHHTVKKSYREFLKALAQLNWDIGLAPLADTPFNRCKAPTKFIEYSACGITTIASNVGPYKDAMPPGCGMRVERDWYDSIARCIADDDGRAQMIHNARRLCEEHYSLRTLAEQIIQVIALAQSEKQ